jgi:hypothetical protein
MLISYNIERTIDFEAENKMGAFENFITNSYSYPVPGPIF